MEPVKEITGTNGAKHWTAKFGRRILMVFVWPSNPNGLRKSTAKPWLTIGKWLVIGTYPHFPTLRRTAWMWFYLIIGQVLVQVCLARVLAQNEPTTAEFAELRDELKTILQ